MKRHSIVSILILLSQCSHAWAWGERGHAIVTRLGVAGLPSDVPAWVREPAVANRLVYLCVEPDRFRGTPILQLGHCNEPNHYFDVESVSPFGMSLKTLPRFRYEFVGRLAAERALHPDRFASSAPADDPKMTKLTPGLLPYEVMECYAQIVSSWSTLRTLEEQPDLAGPEMIASARERVVQCMGLVSHYVGDAAQPLHTTEHHHGWIGANPNGYTKDRKFHSFIDDGVLRVHNFRSADLVPRHRDAIVIAPDHVWEAALEHIDRSHRQVEPLYKLEKSGELRTEPGRVFIEERLLDAGAMLAGIWSTAYKASGHDKYLSDWLKAPHRRDPAPAASQPAAAARSTVR